VLDQAQYALNMGWLAGLHQLPAVIEAVIQKAQRTREELSALEAESVS